MRLARMRRAVIHTSASVRPRRGHGDRSVARRLAAAIDASARSTFSRELDDLSLVADRMSGSDLAGSGLDGQAGLDPVVLAFGVLAHVAVPQRDQLVGGDLGVAAGAV